LSNFEQVAVDIQYYVYDLVNSFFILWATLFHQQVIE